MAIINLALLPDWNSLDSVRIAHSNLELAALVFFALLVVFDVLAHFAEEHKECARLLEKIGLFCFAIAVLCEIVGYRYGQRNDALSDQKIRSLDVVSHDADTTAKGAKTTAEAAKTEADGAKATANQVFSIADSAKRIAVGALSTAQSAAADAVSARKSLAQVKEDVARVEEKYAPRILAKADRDTLIHLLGTSTIRPDKPVQLESFIGASDGVSYGEAIVNAINDPATGWKAEFAAQTTTGGNLKGVVLLFNPNAPTPTWAAVLQQALKAANLGGGGVRDPDLSAGQVIILVAPKN